MVDRLRAQGGEAIAVREPGGTQLGEEIRRLLLHSGDMSPWAEAALFAAGRAQLVAEVVKPALERGVWVVSDRSYYSSLAYQGGARGLGIETVRALNEAVLLGVLPDHVIVIDVDPEVGLHREDGVDRISSAGLDFQKAVAGAYRDIGDSGDPRIRFVSGLGTPDTVVDRIMEIVS